VVGEAGDAIHESTPSQRQCTLAKRLGNIGKFGKIGQGQDPPCDAMAHSDLSAKGAVVNALAEGFPV
jgi:hypothetical protein